MTSLSHICAGVVALQMRKKKSSKNPYIQKVQFLDHGHLAVTMHPELIPIIHDVPYAAADFTFKRVIGKTNEWEVSTFYGRLSMRKSLFYCRDPTLTCV